METATAIRTWKNGKATVTVTFPDGTTAKASGARAARAEAARIVKRSDDGVWVLLGLRANLQAAEAEASRVRQPYEIVHRAHFSRPFVEKRDGNPTSAAIIVTEA